MTTTTTKTKKRVTLFILPSITKQARAQAIIDGLTLSALVEKALLNYLPHKTEIVKIEPIP